MRSRNGDCNLFFRYLLVLIGNFKLNRNSLIFQRLINGSVCVDDLFIVRIGFYFSAFYGRQIQFFVSGFYRQIVQGIPYFTAAALFFPINFKFIDGNCFPGNAFCGWVKRIDADTDISGLHRGIQVDDLLFFHRSRSKSFYRFPCVSVFRSLDRIIGWISSLPGDHNTVYCLNFTKIHGQPVRIAFTCLTFFTCPAGRFRCCISVFCLFRTKCRCFTSGCRCCCSQSIIRRSCLYCTNCRCRNHTEDHRSGKQQTHNLMSCFHFHSPFF